MAALYIVDVKKHLIKLNQYFHKAGFMNTTTDYTH